jgi:nitroreductase
MLGALCEVVATHRVVEMGLSEIILKRRSTRKFLDRPVEREKIEACLEAARLAPSAENVQPWRFIIVDDPQLRERLGEAAFSGIYRTCRFATRAPVVVIILAQPDVVANKLGKAVQGTQYYLLDIGIAGEHFVLAATEMGLGTCWIGWFSKRGVRKLLSIPRKYDAVAMIALGYPNPTHVGPKKKKLLRDIVRYNKFDWK